ncbi:MAG: hypothetical protein ABL965_14475 [Nitrospira sp.]|jgi:hypothetical protein|nr:MAG: hypothetical protein E8D44_14395 [Nitrospira sp.]
MPIIKNGFELRSLEDWELRAGPKSHEQWVDDRSAKEAARAWLGLDGSELPVEVQKALASHAAFSSVREWVAEPEAKLSFDSFPGEPRNSDLVVYAKDTSGEFLVAVEAKADEPFGETVPDALTSALERYVKNTRSNGVTRIQQLAVALLGPRQDGEMTLKDIRYQLLTATAGALCEAERRGLDRAVLLIHEFVTDKTSDEKHDANAGDLNCFVARLSHGAVTSVQPEYLYGPFTVPGAPLLSTKVNLFVGKATRNLRRR